MTKPLLFQQNNNIRISNKSCNSLKQCIGIIWFNTEISVSEHPQGTCTHVFLSISFTKDHKKASTLQEPYLINGNAHKYYVKYLSFYKVYLITENSGNVKCMVSMIFVINVWIRFWDNF